MQGKREVFEYIFNSDKLNLQTAKEKFVEVIKNNPTAHYNANPAFFQNFRYNGLVITATLLQVACLDSNFWQNPLFSFVSVTP